MPVHAVFRRRLRSPKASPNSEIDRCWPAVRATKTGARQRRMRMNEWINKWMHFAVRHRWSKMSHSHSNCTHYCTCWVSRVYSRLLIHSQFLQQDLWRGEAATRGGGQDLRALRSFDQTALRKFRSHITPWKVIFSLDLHVFAHQLSFNRDCAHCWRAFDMSNKYYLLTYLLTYQRPSLATKTKRGSSRSNAFQGHSQNSTGK